MLDKKNYVKTIKKVSRTVQIPIGKVKPSKKKYKRKPKHRNME